MRQVIDRQALGNSDSRRLNTVGTLGRNDMGTQQTPAVAVRNQFDQAARIAGRQRARDICSKGKTEVRTANPASPA